MKTCTARQLGLLVVVLCALAISACNSTPQKPPPPPQPQPRYEPPPPPPPPSSSSTAPTQSQASAQAPAGEFAEPSANAAEVEIEERAVDGSELPPSSEEVARAGGAGGSANDALGGGVDNRPPPSAGGAVLTAGSQSGLVGPQIELGARTDGEQVAALDAELNSQLNAFDERMRRARAAAETERVELARARDGSPAGQQDGRGYRAPEKQGTRGEGGAAATGSGLGNTPDLSGTDKPTSGQSAAYAPPAGLSDGSDDDIVARQLREAASKENDPLLREKLWEEYRKYKAGL